MYSIGVRYVACERCAERIGYSGHEFANAAGAFVSNRRMRVANELCEDGSHAGAVPEPKQLGCACSVLFGSECESGYRSVGLITVHGAESDSDVGQLVAGPEPFGGCRDGIDVGDEWDPSRFP